MASFSFTRIMNLVRRGASSTTVNQNGSLAKTQVTYNERETHNDVPLFQHYGLATSPPLGTDMISVAMGGDNSNKSVIAENHRDSKPTDIQTGDVCLYDAAGNRLWFSGGKLVKLMCVQDMEIDAPGTVTINANMMINGTLKVSKDALIDGRSFIGHMHKGVATGNGTTGPVV